MFSDIETNTIDSRAAAKKTNKPLMEKKRRARINHCLSELKEMLIMDKHNLHATGHAKWEKADILEMTVEYVKKLRAARGLVDMPCNQNLQIEESEDSLLEAKFSRHISPAPSTSSTESVAEPIPLKKARLMSSSSAVCPLGSTTASTSSTSSCSTLSGSPAAMAAAVAAAAAAAAAASGVSVSGASAASSALSSIASTAASQLTCGGSANNNATATTIPLAQPSPLLPVSTPTVLSSNLGFMAQQLMFLHQHNMKMASTAPTFLPTATLPTPIPIMPWRPI